MTIEAGREGDRRIAELAGWTDVRQITFEKMIGVPPGIDPEGDYAPYFDVDHFTTDANAALTLPREESVTLELELVGNAVMARFCKFTSSQMSEASPAWSTAESLVALAICRAFEVYRTREGRQ